MRRLPLVAAGTSREAARLVPGAADNTDVAVQQSCEARERRGCVARVFDRAEHARDTISRGPFREAREPRPIDEICSVSSGSSQSTRRSQSSLVDRKHELVCRRTTGKCPMTGQRPVDAVCRRPKYRPPPRY